MDGDEIIRVENSIHCQILKCQVDDWAIDDAIYVLGESARRGRISTEVYLKRVRNFSRKQFYARALMEKCREVSELTATDQTDNVAKAKENINTKKKTEDTSVSC